MIDGLELTFPWALAALPLLFLLPRARGWLLRVGALAALVIALAGPTVAGPGGRMAVLVDVSDSLGERALSTLDEFEGDWRKTADTYTFAGDAGRVGSSVEAVPELQREVTDLARALQVAAAGGADRILVLSDGAESRGKALLALPPVPIDTYWVPARPNARVAALLVPEKAAPGDTVEAVAVIESDQAASATLTLALAGAEAATRELELPAGRTAVPFRFSVPDDSDARVIARLQVDYEQSETDDSRRAEISVATEEPVLVIGDPALATLLQSQNFRVVEGDPASISAPLPYSAVVVRAPAAGFTTGQLAELRIYVENGGGLMMTGGPESFGFGGWYRTPVEEVLPVDSDLRTELEVPLVALVIVLDRSQSMASGNPSKIELAKEGALGVVDLAYQQDLLGLVTFSDAHDWVFGLRQASERGKREMLAAIMGIGTGGGTLLEPAYRAAVAALRDTNASLKHIIILSDGKLYDGTGPFGQGTPVDFSALSAAAASEGITTSAIAIGRAADYAALEEIAISGGGRYHSAFDAGTLPRIFTNEALTATRSLLRDEPTEPVARPHPLSPYDGPLPPVDAYVATTAKPNAETILVGQRQEPVLAVRRHGLGRTAAFTSDLNGWTGELGQGPELPTMLGAVVRWLQAEPASYSAAVAREGNELRVTVDAVEDGRYVNGARLEARLGGNQVALEQVAPGRYEGRLPGDTNEGNVLVVEGGDVVARAPLGSPHPEFETDEGRDLLIAVSARTGGQTVSDPEGYVPELRTSNRPLWPELLLVALGLFLSELLVRRFGQRGEQREGDDRTSTAES